MTTAIERLAEFGVDIENAQLYVLGLVEIGDLDTILAVCEQFGITAAMLGEIVAYPGERFPEAVVHAYFEASGKDSSGIATPVGPAIIESVSSPTVTEGEAVTFEVTLAATTVEDCPAQIEIGGSA